MQAEALIYCLVVWMVTVSRADITNENPPSGSCLCLDASSVNIRATACGTVIGSGNAGNCFTYRGTKTGCTLNGVSYQFFEVTYGSGSGWIAGTYLNVGAASSCGGSGTPPTTEFRSIFIATAWNVDWPTSSSDSVSAQQQQMLNYLNMMQNTNMNALVYQIRPAGDAFYSSSIEPWSRYLTGTQGQAPNPLWDPLEYTITQAHSRGIEVHAWLNPYRANLANNWNGLAPNHMANVYRQYAYPYSSYLWMDPGAQVVVDHLVSVVSDVVTRYDVDGIHFDDYFYPYSDGTQFPDTAVYNAYVAGGGQLGRDDWRRDNVNRMVQRVYNTIKGIKSSVKFSISPFGIYRPGHSTGMPPPIAGLDPYTTMYADSKLWLQNGWLDFFAPQLYWAIAPPAQSYPTLLDWWLDNNPRARHIYAANGVYKIADTNNWPVSEIENQIAISRDATRRSKQSLGNIMYSAKFFRDNTKGITDAFRTRVYTNKALTPAMSWLNVNIPSAPAGVTVRGRTISWNKADDDNLTSLWSVLRHDDSANNWTQYDVLTSDVTSISVEPGNYSLRAVNKASQESQEVLVTVSAEFVNRFG